MAAQDTRQDDDRLKRALARLATAMGLPADAARDGAVASWLDGQAVPEKTSGASAGHEAGGIRYRPRHSRGPADAPLPDRLAGGGGRRTRRLDREE